MTPDPLSEKYYGTSPYAFCNNNPVNLVDPDGRFPDAIWDVASIGIGIHNLIDNIQSGNIRGAIGDGVGIAVDAIAAAVPLIPGGVGAIRAGAKIANTVDNAADAVRTVSNADDAIDAVKNRVKLRKSTKTTIIEQAPKNANGDFIDPNTGIIVPKEGPFDFGHKQGESWKKRKQEHIERGSTRKEVIEAENDPNLYQIEDPKTNRSRRYD